MKATASSNVPGWWCVGGGGRGNGLNRRASQGFRASNSQTLKSRNRTRQNDLHCIWWVVGRRGGGGRKKKQLEEWLKLADGDDTALLHPCPAQRYFQASSPISYVLGSKEEQHLTPIFIPTLPRLPASPRGAVFQARFVLPCCPFWAPSDSRCQSRTTKLSAAAKQSNGIFNKIKKKIKRK